MKAYVFDTDAMNRFFESETGESPRAGVTASTLAILREIVSIEARKGCIEVLCSPWVATEIMGASRKKAAKFEAMGDLLLELTHGRILMPRQQREPLELERSGPLRGCERFLPVSSQWLRDFMGDVTKVEALSVEHERRKREFMEREKQARAAFRERCVREGYDRRRGMHRSNLVALIEESCHEQLAELGADGTAPGMPFADFAPSLWYSFGYNWFLRALYNFASESNDPKPSDYCDTEVFCDAAYADVLVTNDVRMEAASRALGLNRAVIMSFEEFANRFGVYIGEAPRRIDRLEWLHDEPLCWPGAPYSAPRDANCDRVSDAWPALSGRADSKEGTWK